MTALSSWALIAALGLFCALLAHLPTVWHRERESRAHE